MGVNLEPAPMGEWDGESSIPFIKSRYRGEFQDLAETDSRFYVKTCLFTRRSWQNCNGHASPADTETAASKRLLTARKANECHVLSPLTVGIKFVLQIHTIGELNALRQQGNGLGPLPF